MDQKLLTWNWGQLDKTETNETHAKNPTCFVGEYSKGRRAFQGRSSKYEWDRVE